MNEFERTLEYSLARAKYHGASQAEASMSRDKGYMLEVRDGELDTFENHQGCQIDLTVFCGQRTATVGGTSCSDEAIDRLAQKAVTMARSLQEDPFSGLPDKSEMANIQGQSLELYFDPLQTLQQRQQQLIETEQAVLAYSKDISQCEGVSFDVALVDEAMANSHGTFLQEQSSCYRMSVSAIAKRNEEMQRDSDYTLARDPGDLCRFDQLGRVVAEKTLARLQARKIPSTECPVIFHHGVAKGLVRHFTSAIAGRAIYQDASFLKGCLNQAVFFDQIQIYQRPFLKKAMGSALYDSDGVPTRDLDFIKNGHLAHYILSQYSARQLNMPLTGTANGAHNLIFDMPCIAYEALLKKMDRGLLITDVMGQGVNLVNGDYSRGAMGFWVESGEIQFPVQEITIASNLKAMFKGIVAMADDVDIRGNVRVGSLLIDNMAIAGT